MIKLCHIDGSPCRSDCDQFGECHHDERMRYMMRLMERLERIEKMIEKLEEEK